MQAVIVEERSQPHLHQQYSAKLITLVINHNFQAFLESLCKSNMKGIRINKKEKAWNINSF